VGPRRFIVNSGGGQVSTKINQQRALLGEKTLRCFHKLLQTVKIHENSNQLLIKCIKDFSGVLGLWWNEDGDLTIKLARGRFLIQDEKLFYQSENVKLVQEMYQFFEDRNLSGLCFKADASDYTSKSILELAHLLNDAGEKDD
jgi:hypothetical protein